MYNDFPAQRAVWMYESVNVSELCLPVPSTIIIIFTLGNI